MEPGMASDTWEEFDKCAEGGQGGRETDRERGAEERTGWGGEWKKQDRPARNCSETVRLKKLKQNLDERNSQDYDAD